MGELANRKYELFCRSYAIFASGARAARAAEYATRTAKFQAMRLLKRPEIQARVVELRAEIARNYSLDAATLLCKLEACFIQAYEDRDDKSAARVIESQARVAGILKGRTPPIPPLLALFGGSESVSEHLAALSAAVKTAGPREIVLENAQKDDKG